MEELQPMRRRGNIDGFNNPNILDIDDEFIVGLSLIPRHDNHACTLCLISCLIVWMTSAVGLAIAFFLVYSHERECGVACLIDRGHTYYSCSWLFANSCFDRDDGYCTYCDPPPNMTSLEGVSFKTCCPHHPGV